MSIFSPLSTADRELPEMFTGKIRALYDRMDEAYAKAAACYGFSCNGCNENCCEERFYHHTLSEFLYLLKGIRACDNGKRKEIFDRAREVAGLYAMHDRQGQARRLMCPLNREGLCILYEHRLMICRLHGVPSTMRMPDGRETRAAGCHQVERDMSPDKSVQCMLDRTELYRELAGIEIALRRNFSFGHRIKMTVAEMVTEIEDLLSESA